MFHRFTYMPDYDIWAQKLCTIYLAEIGPRLTAPTEPWHQPVFLSWDDAEGPSLPRFGADTNPDRTSGCNSSTKSTPLAMA